MNFNHFIIKPVVTEKSSQAWENGKYTFVVSNDANKVAIKNAIREIYGVRVVDVNVRPTPQKVRVVGRGREIVKRKAVKKATITLEPGIKLDFYKFQK
ncbi:MAG: 50S ribosomal protein L23 [Candidatus Peregrinibacteria bacterium GW2011_GWA2_44_7]|nr:MAG: 50S ribosomal protein L23 [Candidatus Peregrinibacteria bacterium GW2011_GWA2_44_7]